MTPVTLAGEVVLLRPGWLAALALVAAILLWRRWRGGAAGGWERVMPPAMLAAMRRLGHLRAAAGDHDGALAAAAVLLALGLAGPALPRADAPVIAGSGALLIAVDLSPSVAEGPALADAQAAAAAVLGAAGSRPVGLVLYAGEAYEIAAPTADPTILESQIAVLAPDLMPAGGSRPAAALSLAREMLRGSPGAEVVLVSDGGGIDAAAVAEAERLTGDGIGLSTLVLDGSAGGGGDPATLAALGAATAPARAPGPVLDRLAGGGMRGRDTALAALGFHDLGPLLAALAAIPLLALFRSHA